VPDFIANPGGAIAAFVELTSDVSDEENARTAAKVDEAKHTTRTMVSANVTEVLDLASSAGASPVDAASLLALRRVFGTA
jgi:glutamate dehydrogenase (NAD(P)+)